MTSPVLNKVRERLLFLSPTVQAGWEPESKIDDFEVVKLLGQGAFGVVKKVNHRKTNISYAIKIVDKKMLKQTGMVEQMVNEVRIMYSLNHPYILKLYNHFEDDTNIYLVLEYSPGGQLYAVLWKQPSKRFNEKTAAKFILQLTLSLEHIHTKGIIHRDIKPENILLDQSSNIKLADFGWSNFLKPDEVRQTFCGTLDYLAPEMLDKGHKHGHEVDIWSIAVLCFELLSGISPFAPRDNMTNQNYVEKATRDNIKNVKYNFDKLKDFPDGAKDLISKVLVKNPSDRYTCEQIRNHPWIKENTKDLKIPASITMELEKKQIVKNAEIDSMQQEGKTAFTNEEIYQYTRPDSIIVKDYEPNKGQQAKMMEVLNQKVKQLEQKVSELDIENKKKQAENDSLKQQIDILKSSGQVGQEVVNIQHKMKLADEKYLQAMNQYQMESSKNVMLEQRVKELDQQLKEMQELKSSLGKYKNRAKEAENKFQELQIENYIQQQLKSKAGSGGGQQEVIYQYIIQIIQYNFYQKDYMKGTGQNVDDLLAQLKQKHNQQLN